MARLILLALIWLAAIGLVLFCFIYLLVKPWRDPMGRHILAFMGSLGLAFVYLLFAYFFRITDPIKIYGWIIIIAIMVVTIWWRLIILLKLQFENREVIYNIWQKIRGK